MKKSIVILIALIYVASIALVGYIGLKPKSYNDVIYVERLEILNDYDIDNKSGEKFLVFRPTSAEEKSIRIECKVYPEKAKDTKVIYKLKKEESIATIDENGLLTFTAALPGESVTVYIYSNQNTSIQDTIDIIYNPKY